MIHGAVSPGYRRKVIVFGGSFSPPTVAHETIIKECLTVPGFTEVWVMPSGSRKDKVMSAGDGDRLAMLEIVKRERCRNDPRLIVTAFELRLPRPSATYRTVAALGRDYPETEFWFVLGADSYLSMTTPAWEHGAALQQSLRILVVGRGARELPERDGLRALDMRVPEDISSTAVRAHVRARRPLGGLVSEPVARYIRDHGLYRS